jgi:hypothetical protein
MKLPNLNDCTITPTSKSGYVYDEETYPDFFCISFYNGKDQIQFEISKRKNDLNEIVAFIENKVLIGFNNSHFDDLILNYIIREKSYLIRFKGEEIAKGLFSIAGEIINHHNENQKSDLVRELRRMDVNYVSIDLMKLLSVQKSLKLIGVSLKWPNIQDLPYVWDQPLETEEKMQVVIDYNKNDTGMTLALCKKLEKEIELRYNLSKLYNVNVLDESDSGICNVLFEKMYREKAGNKHFRELRTHRSKIHLKDCVVDGIFFKTQELKNLLNLIQTTTLHKTDKGFKLSLPPIKLNNRGYQLGVGGLHSVDEGAIFESSEDLLVMDSDVASYYPTLMINHNIKPAHLENGFIDVLRELRLERLKGKKIGDKVKSEGLKIVINSAFGKLGFEGSFFYDEQAMLSVTLNGQLYLLMLIERLNQIGLDVVSANTDGIVTLVPKDKYDDYIKICSAWEKETYLELEYTKYKKYVRRDVNNYITQTEDGKIKAKGAFLQEIDLKKGYKYPVVSKVLKEYFLDGKSLEDSLRCQTDIYDFCMAQKMGKQFTAQYDGNDMQNSVRFYVSNSGNKLLKWKLQEDGSKSFTDLCAGFKVELFNQFQQKENYDLNYDFYLKEIRKITQEVNQSQNFIW